MRPASAGMAAGTASAGLAAGGASARMAASTASAGMAASTVDAALEASVVGSFSRIGIEARSRLLPEFRADLPSLRGRRVVITGATSGIGLAAATRLATLGASVYFVARDHSRAVRAWWRISEGSGSQDVRFGIADLTEPESVRDWAAEYASGAGHADVLIHNAGALHPRYLENSGGVELTVAGQVIGPFAMTRLLLPALRAAGQSRVITVSSGGMYTQRLDPATLRLPPDDFAGATAYARAKRAQVALSHEWARRLAGTGVAFHAMHPGWVNTPGLAAALPRFGALMRPVLRTADQGADTIVWLASADPAVLGTGSFWHDRRRRPVYRVPGTRDRPGAAERLWSWLADVTAAAPGQDGLLADGRAITPCEAG